MYRIVAGSIEVLLAHPGGPFYARKDAGYWSIPKGEPEPGEELLATAEREFAEETGFEPNGPYIELTPIVQKGGKVVHAWAFAGNCDPTALRSVTFQLEWPARSGRLLEFPEVDRAAFFEVEEAKEKIKQTQAPLIDQLARHLQVR
jgi:predicted NUDIX family NTP pyrophosphohydrolase